MHARELTPVLQAPTLVGGQAVALVSPGGRVNAGQQHYQPILPAGPDGTHQRG